MWNFKRIAGFYIDGFKNMPGWARILWVIILLKLFVMFVVFRLFFFQNELKTKFSNDEDRANHVIEQITKP